MKKTMAILFFTLIVWFSQSTAAEILMPQTNLAVQRVSVSTGGAQGNGDSGSFGIYMPAEGSRVYFASPATNLVAGDTNGTWDIFVRDLNNDQTDIISTAQGGIQGDQMSSNSVYASADGRYVVFQSSATNLVANDTNGYPDVFLKDMNTGYVELISVATDDTQGDDGSGWSGGLAVSNDGRYVAFTSHATNLVTNDTNGFRDTFLRDRQAGTTIRISVSNAGEQGNDYVGGVDISGDGSYITFSSRATNLTAEQLGGMFLYHVPTQQLDFIASSNVVSSPQISLDGVWVVFYSDNADLVTEDTNNVQDTFLYNRLNGTFARVSVSTDSGEGNGASWYGAISSNAQYVAFASEATNLVSDDNNGVIDIFVRDMESGQTIRVSKTEDGVEANNASRGRPLTISADGQRVAFSSTATNLVANDTNGEADAFVVDILSWEDLPPTAVSDLTAIEGSTAGTVDLSWTAPGGDGDVGTAVSYAVRYADSPIVTELGWLNATDVPDEPLPQTAGTMQNMTVSGLAAGQTYYFAIRAEDDAGQMSGLSNSPSVTLQSDGDTGFLPEPNGYQFENGSGHTSWEIFRDTFGADNVEWTIAGKTVKKPAALAYFTIHYNGTGAHGVCSAMSASSGLIYKTWVDPSDFLQQQGVANTWEIPEPVVNGSYWENDAVANLLLRYQGYQQGQEIRNAKRTYNMSLEEMVNALTGSIDNGFYMPYYLSISGPYGNECVGHALLPYDYEQNNDIVSVYVYDPNHPGGSDQFVNINLADNSWEYDHKNSIGTWGSNKNCADIKALALSLWQSSPTPPWNFLGLPTTTALSENAAFYDVSVQGDANLLIIDDHGREIGYRDGAFQNTIPNASLYVPDDVIPGVVPSHPERYDIDLNTNFTVTVNYTEPGSAEVNYFMPQGVVAISGFGQSQTTDHLVVDRDSQMIEVKAGSMSEDRSLSYLSQQDEWADIVEVSNFSLGENEVVQLDLAEDGIAAMEKIRFYSSGTINGYEISLSNTSLVTTTDFKATNLMMTSGDTHIITVDYDNVDRALLEIDHMSDGSIDETIVLENEAEKSYLIYLPVVMSPE